MININNLPATAVPLVLLGRATAPLVGTKYVWNIQPQSMLPQHEMQDNTLYIIDNFSFSADITELDYQSSIDQVPEINLYQTGQGRVPILRSPILAPIYYQNFPFVWSFSAKQSPNELLFSARGSLNQTPNLIGKTEITLNMILSVYEVHESNFIKHYMQERGIK